MSQKRSTLSFFTLPAILVVAVVLNYLLPQGQLATLLPESQSPKSKLALNGARMTAVLYGLLGYLGLILWRNLGFPEIWAESVTDRQRFLIPALVGGALGLVPIVSDLVFSPFNGIGRLMHPLLGRYCLASAVGIIVIRQVRNTTQFGKWCVYGRMY
jgi:hypothetical protein